ncbi:unnamed protein product [Pedinophyceae sp. YPF-701]|nr:unnamed protein product [Pedinophyceae sp. YPF-701]
MTTRREPAGLSKRLKDEALTMEATLSELRTQMAAERAKREQARMKAKQQGSIWRTGQTGALRGSSVKNIVRDGSGRSRPTKSNSMASHAKNRAPSATAPSPPPGVVSGRTVTPPVGLNQDASATTRAPPADESAWEMPSFMQGPPVATGIGVAGAQTGLSDASPPRAAHAGGAQAQQRRFAVPCGAAARRRTRRAAQRSRSSCSTLRGPRIAPAPGGAMGASRRRRRWGCFNRRRRGPGRGKAGGAAAGEAAEVPLTHARSRRSASRRVRKDPMLMATSTGRCWRSYDGGAAGPGGALLDGEFDEEANAREFQAALAAWRDGGDGGGSRASARARTPPRTPPKLRGPSLLDGEFDEEANAREFRAALAAWRGEGDAVPGGAAADIQTEGSQPLRPLAKPAAAEAPSSYFERIQSNMMARTAGRAAARMTTCAAPVVAAVMASARASEAGEGERGEAAEEAQDRAAEAVREWDGAESEAGVQDGSARAAAGPRAVPDDDSDDDAPPPMPRELPPAPDGNVAEGVSAPDATHPPEAPPEAGPPPEAATPAPRSDPEGHGGYDLLAMLREGAAGDDAQPISASLPPPPAPRAGASAEPAPRARAPTPRRPATAPPALPAAAPARAPPLERPPGAPRGRLRGRRGRGQSPRPRCPSPRGPRSPARRPAGAPWRRRS